MVIVAACVRTASDRFRHQLRPSGQNVENIRTSNWSTIFVHVNAQMIFNMGEVWKI